jgi:hypothetical protein
MTAYDYAFSTFLATGVTLQVADVAANYAHLAATYHASYAANAAAHLAANGLTTEAAAAAVAAVL